MIKIAYGNRITKLTAHTDAGLDIAINLGNELERILSKDGFRRIETSDTEGQVFENKEGGIIIFRASRLNSEDRMNYGVNFYGRPKLVTDGLVAKVSDLYRKHGIKVVGDRK